MMHTRLRVSLPTSHGMSNMWLIGEDRNNPTIDFTEEKYVCTDGSHTLWWFSLTSDASILFFFLPQWQQTTLWMTSKQWSTVLSIVAASFCCQIKCSGCNRVTCWSKLFYKLRTIGTALQTFCFILWHTHQQAIPQWLQRNSLCLIIHMAEGGSQVEGETITCLFCPAMWRGSAQCGGREQERKKDLGNNRGGLCQYLELRCGGKVLAFPVKH